MTDNIILLLGPPGSGKDTLGPVLAQKCHVPHIGVGALRREEMAKVSPFGRRLTKAATDRELTDSLVIDLVEQRIGMRDCEEGYVLNGCPRTWNQSLYLDFMLEEHGDKIGKVIHLQAPEDELVQRLSGRYNCANAKCGAIYHERTKPLFAGNCCDVCGGRSFARRPEDCIEQISYRLNWYRKNSPSVTRRYANTGLLSVVETGGLPPEQVAAAIEAQLQLV